MSSMGGEHTKVKTDSARMNELMENIIRVRFSDLELERQNSLELLALADKCGSSYVKAFAYTYLGDYYLAQSDAENSGQYLHWARELCTEHDYEALYMRACHLSGFYYHIICDEQNALQYYLQALAEKFDDIQQICNTWNNIADMFQVRGAYEEAKQYYLRAYEAMISHGCHDIRLMLIILHNLAEVTGFSGDADGMEQFLVMGEALEPGPEIERKMNQINMLAGRCVQAALRKDRVKAVKIAEEILTLHPHELEDRYFIMEMILPVAQALVNLGEVDCFKQYYTLLSDCSNLSEASFAQRLLRLRILYAETFADVEERNASYREYYDKMQTILSTEDSVRVSGMNAKIHLQQVIRQQESTQRENKRLEDAVNVDPLTGIYNRRYFDRCMEDTAQTSFGVIMLDIDYFKEFNDNYGHIQGDQVLREIGAALKAYASDKIKPCRYGGDEFSCICRDCTDQEIEAYVTSLFRWMKELNLPHEHSGCAGRVTLSIGYCCWFGARTKADPKKILAGADIALYRAKSEGRNCWCREKMEVEHEPST